MSRLMRVARMGSTVVAVLAAAVLALPAIASADTLPPTADAGQNQTVHVGSLVSLDGSGSSDPDNEPLTYAWSFDSKPAGSQASLSDTTAVAPTFTPDKLGDYGVRLTVTDPDGSADFATVTISAQDLGPVADAGTGQSAAVGSSVSLSGSESYDPDGDPLTYTWSFVSRPAGSGAALSDVHAVSPSFTPDVAGTYILGLVVNDGFIDSTQATVQVLAAPSAASLAATLLADTIGVAPGSALSSKATAIQADVRAGNKTAACADIANFLSLVKAQTAKKLKPAQVTLLTTDATKLATTLGC